jgi:chaperonin GroEL
MTEKRHRIEDALEAVRSAQMEGVVPGGGVALIRSVQNIEVETDNAEQAYGVELVKKAVLAPLRRMASNAGLSPDLVQADVLGASGLQGVDFTTGNVVDMMDAGILDPAKVTRCALQNAASVATTLFTTSHAIIQKN